jgi:hypothetical protein
VFVVLEEYATSCFQALKGDYNGDEGRAKLAKDLAEVLWKNYLQDQVFAVCFNDNKVRKCDFKTTLECYSSPFDVVVFSSGTNGYINNTGDEEWVNSAYIGNTTRGGADVYFHPTPKYAKQVQEEEEEAVREKQNTQDDDGEGRRTLWS